MRTYIARLRNDAATQSLSIPNGAQVQWARGGAAPEVAEASFELSTDGGAHWSALGAGTRTADGWERIGLSLPSNGTIRARGRTTAGLHMGSSGQIESVAAFTVTSPDADDDGLLDSWELTYWPTTVGHNADDDWDHDGLKELLELAFGLDPTVPDSQSQPAAIVENGYLTMTVIKRPGVNYEVQSAGMVRLDGPDSFSAATTVLLIDDATTLKVRDSVAFGNTSARFLRVKVTAAPQ